MPGYWLTPALSTDCHTYQNENELSREYFVGLELE